MTAGVHFTRCQFCGIFQQVTLCARKKVASEFSGCFYYCIILIIFKLVYLFKVWRVFHSVCLTNVMTLVSDWRRWFLFLIFTDVNAGHSCYHAELGEDTWIHDKCQQARETSREKSTHSKDTTEQEQNVTDTRSTQVLPFSDVDPPSEEPARITSCGKISV